MLPTPMARDGKGRDIPNREGGLGLVSAVHLLPSPKATNNENRQTAGKYRPNLGMALRDLSVPTPPPSSDGPPSSDDPPRLQLWPAD